MVSLGVSRPPKDNMSPSTGVLGIPATLLIEPPGADVAVQGSPTRAAAGGIVPRGVVSALSMSLQAAVPVHGSPTRAAAGGIAPRGVMSALSMSLQAAVPGPV